MAKQIKIDITPAGSAKIEAIGFNGKGCASATEMIEVAIGGAPANANRKKKPEFFASPSAGQKVKQGF